MARETVSFDSLFTSTILEFRYRRRTRLKMSLQADLVQCITLCDSLLVSTVASSCSKPAADPAQEPVPVTDIRHDYGVLAALIGKGATALSLSLKPPPSLPTARAILLNLTNHLTRLGICLNAPSTSAAGALLKEIKCVP